jgi:hypothetical protein
VAVLKNCSGLLPKMVSSGYVFSVSIGAAANSPSIEIALAFTGEGCFDYMGK